MTDLLTLNDGSSIPDRGFGTYPLRGEDGHRALLSALESGYRLLDSAVNYENEGVVGAAARDFATAHGIDRAEITVQTKLPGRHHDYDAALASGYESAKRLGVDRIDVLLIHWPNPTTGKFTEAWRALVELRDRGLVRTIGTSNFSAPHLEAIVADSGVTPAINQIELHPYFSQEDMRALHAQMGVVTQAWSPLGKNTPVLTEPAILDAAAAHGVTPAQVVLRWHLQLGSVALPKSATPERQRQNIDLDGFALTDAQMAAIDALTKPDGRWFGGDPATHEEM